MTLKPHKLTGKIFGIPVFTTDKKFPATSAECGLHSQTEGNTISTTEAQGNTPPTKKSDPSEWLTVKEAFRRLGGDPDSAASVVTSKDGRRKVKFGTFRTLRAQDYKAFGLELNGSRRGAKKPYFRLVVHE